MKDLFKKFTRDAEVKAFDPEHRRKINFNISRYDIAVEKGKKQYKNIEVAKKRAAHIKHKIVNKLDDYLIEFEANFTSRGGKVIWALDANEALKEIIAILRKNEARNIVKSKSMITEELEFNEALQHEGIESLETDLGEYIVQLDGDKPYHIVTPAMHKSKEDIAALFNKKFGTPIESTPEDITAFVRKLLREKFANADVGVTGANFIIADIGAIALTENEGNALMSVSFPRIHIAIVGIEKIIPSMEDLDLFWPLLATHGTGQNITVYNTIVTGPRQRGEADGPEEMYVVLVDNRRTELLAQKEQRRALSCIRCGACLNNCPVYKNIGGHTYGATYSGPIGSVITPYLKTMHDYKHLSFASSLCGKCTEVCPVKINLHELLLYNRNDSVKRKEYKFSDKIVMFGWKTVMLHRWMIDFASAKIKNIVIKKFFEKVWGPRRAIPEVKPKSFHQLWKEKEALSKH